MTASLYRGPDGEIRLFVQFPAEQSMIETRQIIVDRKTVLALIEDGARMVREDAAKI